jgi:fatty-acid desaturase
MRPGGGESYSLSASVAANDNRRRRPTWRRLVAAVVVGAFTLMLVTLGFTRYAHHPAYGIRPSTPLLNPN